MIVTDQKILRQVSKEFKGTYGQLSILISQLEYELKNSKIPGVGLSAIQIGIPIQVAIIRTSTLQLNLYNAKIVEYREPFIFKNEGCLSVPNIFKNTQRFNFIKIENGDGKQIILKGYNSVVAQHEQDHWKGILFLDRTI